MIPAPLWLETGRNRSPSSLWCLWRRSKKSSSGKKTFIDLTMDSSDSSLEDSRKPRARTPAAGKGQKAALAAVVTNTHEEEATPQSIPLCQQC